MPNPGEQNDHPDLPFDPATATVPNHTGRVVDPDRGERVTGT